MSRVLTQQEAEQIVESILKPLGFTVTVLHIDENADADHQYQLCNVKKVTKTIGSLWWKKKVESIRFEPVFSGWCWEDAIEKMDQWVAAKVGPRVDLADKFREQQTHYLLDKKLEE